MKMDLVALALSWLSWYTLDCAAPASLCHPLILGAPMM